MTQIAAVQPKADEADQLRADLYRLLARLFSGPLDGAALASVAGLQGDGSELGQAISALATTARDTTPEAAAEEYQQIFVGVSRGLLLPYGSYYTASTSKPESSRG